MERHPSASRNGGRPHSPTQARVAAFWREVNEAEATDPQMLALRRRGADLTLRSLQIRDQIARRHGFRFRRSPEEMYAECLAAREELRRSVAERIVRRVDVATLPVPGGSSDLKCSELRGLSPEKQRTEIARMARRALRAATALGTTMFGEDWARKLPPAAGRRRAARGRAPRPATNARSRGSRRSLAATARPSRGDPDSAGDPDEPRPHAPRLCACGCGANLDELGKRPQARYVDDAHRMRASRGLDGAALERRAVIAAASAAPEAALEAFRRLSLSERSALVLDALRLSGEEALLAVLYPPGAAA
ncbi:hypothetical protein SAMN02745716_0008 [Thermoleophilum album]|uniref:Uncharacterized protein n=2 Tax=Thermoleophilum album TaxID=29539 RepID=A0A1H6FIC0_THEAL|nr:hypothetical protein SAMN02745716_0008 [Thermoleophilum album]